jgi:excisionase family DNA binding protein
LIERSASSPDPLLTLAEIAAELRVNPATVRSWVSRGHLNAFRAGQRKWVVRRSELDRMIDASNASASSATTESREPSVPPPRRPSPSQRDTSPTDVAGPSGPAVNGRDAAELVRIAKQNLAAAFAASRCAPPAPGYLDRLRAIADSFEHTASALRSAADVVGMRWQPPSSFGWDELPYELRPEGNRPGERELWEKFDAAVERLAITLSGTDVRAVADGHAELRDTLLDVADRLEGNDSHRQAIWAG